MSLFAIIHSVAHDLHERRVRYLTERAISGLSPQMRKDIGWPDTGEGRRPRERTFRA